MPRQALSELTTMRVGGPAARLVTPTTPQQLVDATIEAWASGDDWLILGGGSNVVIADDGFDGTVIVAGTRGIERLGAEGDRVHLRVQAGEPWDALVAHTVSQGWAGLEALSGIPGSSGAAPIQNIGAYGQELSSTLVAIEFLDYLTGALERVPASELALDYRTSSLKQGRQGLVVSIELELVASGGLSEPIAYPQLASALGVELGARVPLDTVRGSVLALRASKGMVLDPADPDSVSCGSFFTNPIVSENFARSLPVDAPRWLLTPEPRDVAVPLGQQPAEPPALPIDPHVKLSAAWLIERAGVDRGFALPGSRAAISSKHSLAITNRGGATAAEIAELARFIQARVIAQFGVELHLEPNLVGIHL